MFLKSIFSEERYYKTSYDLDRVIRVLNNKRVENDYRIRITKKDDNSFDIKTNAFLGTAYEKGILSLPFSFNLILTKTKSNNSKIQVNTKPRKEYFFSIPFLVYWSIAVNLSYEWSPRIFIISLITPIVFFSFHVILMKRQEAGLFEKIEDFLKLKHTHNK